MEGRFVTYYRVSTAKQGRSGLGLEAQKETVTRYLNGGNWEVVGTYTEVESGKRDDRPELEKAIRDCKLKGARLLVAKLDRLSRDLHFITSLQKAGVPFTVAEMPDATELTVHIYAAMAEHERKVISQRTRAALQAAKAKGKKLGNPCLQRGEQIPGSGAPKNANKARIEKADDFARQMAQIIQEMRSEGDSLRDIADSLNNAGYRTARGKEWQAASVKRVLDRVTPREPEMKMIVMGDAAPKSFDGTTPKTHNLLDAHKIVKQFNKEHRGLKAEIGEVMYKQESFVVLVFDTNDDNRFWGYL
ncbi:Resolvase domain protein [Desulfobulbus propionicus DSM 2032]|uniref:Resolvase domain protein n=1 Tax=Desulfobulbus propionicus (strain ATCC 33891 / DSM 2032 / VKM B-1956 / 1pr3) TaxID=577650 RepID=A0A7U3YNV6_DESPD|nr:recombinase family protein [Desulfobulbus propionicus]ADW18823.1 Resolvase domain protein [Desulfobulbus propionicus DSM 2032]